MVLGPTHWRWRPDVAEEAAAIKRRFPSTRCNTYEGHPWPGWDGRSIDVWFTGGRGDALPYDLAQQVRRYVVGRPGAPWIRHWILEHQLWTSFGGYSYWAPNDHNGWLRHYHVTFW